MSFKYDLLEDSEFPAQISSPSNPDASSRFSFFFTQNIHRIEQASGCFICTLCPPAGSYHNSESLLDSASQPFSADPTTFETHLSIQHASLSNMPCVYCGCRVACSRIVNHVLQHIRKGVACLCKQTGLSKHSSLFSCPAEPTCSLSFRTNQFKLLQHHWSTEHDTDQHAAGSPQSHFSCTTCLHSFPSLSAWAEHIRRHALSLVHCCAPGCLVKSPSRSLLLEHCKRRHSHLMQKPSGDSHMDDNLTSSGLILETVEMVCNRPEQSSPGERVPSSSSRPGGGVCLPDDFGADGYEPSLVFVLRCPYCALVTIRWNHFLQHASACPGLMRTLATASVYQCRVYWCSLCMAVSTERTLVWEHLMHAHANKSKGGAMVVREHMIVKLLDVDGHAAAPSLPAASLDAQLYSSDLSIGFSGYVNESPLNLTHLSTAASAKPPSHYLCGGSGTSVTPTISVCTDAATPAMPFLPTPSTAQTAALQDPANSSVSANTAAASPGDAVACPASGFVASEAAMAAVAAALSELTNSFDVNASMSVTAAAAAAALNSIASAAAVSGLPAIPPSNAVLPPSTASSTMTMASGTTRTPTSLADVSMVSSGTGLAKPSVEGSSKDQVHPEDVGRTGEDIVSFPFDEEKFRAELTNNIRASMVDILVSKMQRFSAYCVRILGKENHRRIPVCPECEKVFPYGLGDFKRHLLTVHLEVPREYLKDCLKFTYLPKSEEKFQEVQEQLAMRQMRPRLLEPGRRRIPLPYSIPILRRLTAHLAIQTREFLEQNMQKYSRLSVIVDTRGGFRKYKCNQCLYSSPHALADVRKHILGSHCGISTKHFRHCLQASRLDPVEFTLFTDEKLSRLARNFLHRRQLSEAEASGELASVANDRNGYSTALDGGPSLSALSLDQSKRPSSLADDSYVSHFTTVVPGSKNRVTVRIRPPVPPNGSPTDLAGTSAAATAADGVEHMATTPRSSESPNSAVSEFHTTQTTSCGSILDVSSLPPIPGLEGADRVVELALPFSEPVLRQLLTVAGSSGGHVAEVVEKMRVYSTYCMTRICRRDRTLAFRCPCGRLFMTTRQPDSKIRAATLADSRRHVMGVHARIPHEFITICCQASRITREYDFQIYPDDMLLRLAMDRPIKLANLPQASTSSTGGEGSVLSSRANSVNPVALHPLRPLKELMPHSATPPLSTSSPSSCGNNLASASSSHTSHRSAAGTGKREDSLGEAYNNNIVTGEDENDDDADEELDEVGEDTVKKTQGSGRSNAATGSLANSSGSRMAVSDDTPDASSKGSDHKVLEDPLLHLTMAQASPDEEVERIIHLPYSSDALYSLVQGYCPPTYFPVLQEKMDIYSSLKVFITRRRGRRYFCCSGCSSASPHGMGDIRKHILGVHAKVPERYKAAAMHCSRLSREDNTLLPNHVLLHLAKMKWKGTVIKPLAEMDLSQFGSRRASAVGLLRNSASASSVASMARQFASQVYQPNTSHHAHVVSSGGGSDSVDRLTTGSANLYSTSVDSQQLLQQQQTSSAEEAPLHVIKMPTACELGQSAAGCFYACSGCSFTSANLKAVRAHIVRLHMQLPVHRCAHCDASFTTRKEAVNHHQQAHTELEFFFGQYLPAYRSAMAKLAIVDVSVEPAHPTLDTANYHQFADESSEGGGKRAAPDSSQDEEMAVDNEDYEDSFEDLSEFEHDSQRPSKFRRLDDHHHPSEDPGCLMSNGTESVRPSTPQQQHLVNGRRNSGSPGSTASPLARPYAYCEPQQQQQQRRPLGLSGSSRRKPSKMHLIQLKPSPLRSEDS